ncbi:MAG: NADPH-dependent FMN reductase [Flavobacterium sp. MedPE-SWcel]|uniref:NADPH-dependent FMN reductase n=1 Tax=uncultured Flavobacterium sp. TaxID=165435 RepID=UPI00091755B0|nr:NAD(P)H-dependent oxidoreductase [uncultured Flavobacterium sp.]OIQ16912.1 MAG: NADPH-dependent FMN reductase [Flavobacterium sp. MedPE-SWcel]
MKIVTFAGSSSTQSINKRLATYAAGLFQESQLEVLDLNDYELPLFSLDKEQVLGKPAIARAFLDKMESADVLVLSLAEHNGSYSTAFKNIYDWASRQKKEVFDNTPMLLMATSPGGRGGSSVLETAKSTMPHYGGNIKAVFSLPSFHNNFDVEAGKISNNELDAALKDIIRDFDYAKKDS